MGRCGCGRGGGVVVSVGLSGCLFMRGNVYDTWWEIVNKWCEGKSRVRGTVEERSERTEAKSSFR